MDRFIFCLIGLFAGWIIATFVYHNAVKAPLMYEDLYSRKTRRQVYKEDMDDDDLMMYMCTVSETRCHDCPIHDACTSGSSKKDVLDAWVRYLDEEVTE